MTGRSKAARTKIMPGVREVPEQGAGEGQSRGRRTEGPGLKEAGDGDECLTGSGIVARLPRNRGRGRRKRHEIGEARSEESRGAVKLRDWGSWDGVERASGAALWRRGGLGKLMCMDSVSTRVAGCGLGRFSPGRAGHVDVGCMGDPEESHELG